MVTEPPADDAHQFLDMLRKDEDIRRTIDSAIDDNIFTLAVALGAQRGYKFDRTQLEAALVERLGLGEFTLADADGGAGKCQSSSGCRTPCVYCNSNRPAIIDVVEKIKHRFDRFCR